MKTLVQTQTKTKTYSVSLDFSNPVEVQSAYEAGFVVALHLKPHTCNLLCNFTEKLTWDDKALKVAQRLYSERLNIFRYIRPSRLRSWNSPLPSSTTFSFLKLLILSCERGHTLITFPALTSILIEVSCNGEPLSDEEFEEFLYGLCEGFVS